MLGVDGALAKCREMLVAIAHRGEPNFLQEMWCQGSFAVGTNRLAISDPGQGAQPIVSADGRYIVVFNGEIYNLSEMHSALRDGYSFSTSCDSELILAGYLKWGEALVTRLRGMYAFCVFDTKTKSYVLARDPLGIKPLYYGHTEHGVVFCSELKGMPEQLTEIHSLPPGCILTPSKQSSFYVVPPFESVRKESRLEDYKSGLREKFLSTVESHIVDATGEVACLLSGGVDSSSVLYALREVMDRVSAWTFAIEGGKSEDLDSARIVCESLAIPLRVVSIPIPDLQKFYLEQGVYCVETFEPPLVRNAVSYYFLCKAVREAGFKFALSGEGADEIFGGYGYLDFFPAQERDQKVRESLVNVHRSYLQMADRASMYATLEVRVPYLDSDLVDMVAQMPANVRHDGKTNKAILRELFPGLPASIRYRKKTGMNQGAGYGSNDPMEGVYYEGVTNFYYRNPSRYLEDRRVVSSSSLAGILRLRDMEEVYNAAQFVRHGFSRLKGCTERIQLNTSAVSAKSVEVGILRRAESL